ncbi:MAG: hypothetical protein ACE5QW_06545 [Thermoplasmata archaeon]
MPRELIILVRSGRVAVQKERYNPFYGHWCTAGEISHKIQELSSEEAMALTRIQEFAKHENVVFKILRASDLWVRLKYGLRKDERTPLIVCGKKIFRGVPSMSDLSDLVR